MSKAISWRDAYRQADEIMERGSALKDTVEECHQRDMLAICIQHQTGELLEKSKRLGAQRALPPSRLMREIYSYWEPEYLRYTDLLAALNLCGREANQIMVGAGAPPPAVDEEDE